MNTEIYKGARLHAYLVLSPDALQRKKISTRIAKEMLCDNKKDDGSFCGVCSDCIKIDNQTHPDCIYLGSQTKSVSVKTVRAALENAYLAPNEANGKVFILENADTFNEESQNALLKIIEEPPTGVKFVLTAGNKNALLPTVLSRVFVVSADEPTFDQYVSAVKRKDPSLSEENAKSLAFFCMHYEGANIDTIALQSFFDAQKLAFDFFSGKEKNLALVLPTGRDTLTMFLQVFMLVAKEIIYCISTGKTRDYIMDAQKLADCCARTSAKKAMGVYSVLEEAFLRIDDNANINAATAYILQNI